MNQSVRLFVRLGMALAVILGLAISATGVSAQDADANVRVIHASPDAPNVDIWVNGTVAIEDLAFGEATDWIALPADSYDVAVTPTGGEPGDAVIEATLELEGGVNYNVAAIGFVADIAATVFTTDAADLGADMARVQVIHASPDAPAVDIAVAGGDVLVPGLEFPNASGALDVPAGSYDLEVRVAGTEDVALDLPGVELAAGTVYDILAIGSVADGSLTVLPLTTAAMAAVGGGTEMPDTGVGSTMQQSSSLLLILAVLAVAGLASSFMLKSPVRRRF